MILQLRNGTITVKDNRVPEDISGASVEYEFELGTNHLIPVLTVEAHVYNGDKVTVPFDYNLNEISLRVDLMDGAYNVVRTYNGTFRMYRTFTLGTQEHIDIYKELETVKAQLKELQEKGDIV